MDLEILKKLGRVAIVLLIAPIFIPIMWFLLSACGIIFLLATTGILMGLVEFFAPDADSSSIEESLEIIWSILTIPFEIIADFVSGEIFKYKD